MSTRTVDRYVEAFDKPIKQACEKGQSMIRASNVITARADYVKFSGTLGPYDRLKVTDIQQAVIDSFVKYGFAVYEIAARRVGATPVIAADALVAITAGAATAASAAARMIGVRRIRAP